MDTMGSVSQRSWVRFPFKPEFFQVSSFQPFRLRELHCDDLHIIPQNIRVVHKTAAKCRQIGVGTVPNLFPSLISDLLNGA